MYEHQSGSRSSGSRLLSFRHEIVGYPRTVQKPFGPALSDRRDQPTVADLGNLDFLTSSGKATAFGNRTAWLRFVVNNVDRAATSASCDIRWDIRGRDGLPINPGPSAECDPAGQAPDKSGDAAVAFPPYPV